MRYIEIILTKTEKREFLKEKVLLFIFIMQLCTDNKKERMKKYIYTNGSKLSIYRQCSSPGITLETHIFKRAISPSLLVIALKQ